MTNEIIIRSVYGKVNQVYFIQPCPNPRTGKLPDCVKPVNSHGDMILSEDDVRCMSNGTKHFIPADKVFQITDGTRFDLSDVVDAANWEAIKFCNWIAKDRSERDEAGNLIIDGGTKRYGAADLYVDRPGETVKRRVDKKQIIFKASQYVYEDSESNRIKKAKVLGRDLKNASPSDVLDFLIDISEKTPNKIIDLYEGEDWKIQLFVIEAIDRGVIKKDGGIYKYDENLIGGSINSIIDFVKDIRYKKVVDSIKRETYPELLPKQELDKMKEELNSDIMGSSPTKTKK